MSRSGQQHEHVEIELVKARLGALRNAVDQTEELLNRYIVAESALRESENRLRLFIEGVKDYAMFMLDVHGNILSWNTGAQRIKGYTASEIIGKHFSIFYPPEDLERNKPAHELVVAAREGQYQEEGWRLRKDGSRFWAHVLITAVFDERRQLRGFGKVTRDMTERKLADEERDRLRASEWQLEREREARRQTEAMLEMRDDFLTVTAHELRTPITSLLGYAELLQRRLSQGQLSAERMERPIAAVMEQAQRLDRLTTTLLDVSRLEHRQLVLQQQPLDLRATLERVVNGVALLADHHTLNSTLPFDPVMINGDELRLEQIFHNLLQNALKYSPAGGTITTELGCEKRYAVVTVMDQGIGIPDDDRAFLFDRFYRATNVPTQQISGLGVGLYIVKELVTLHGGMIDVQSQIGEGSTFTLRFPLLS